MKQTILILLTAVLMVSCTKTEVVTPSLSAAKPSDTTESYFKKNHLTNYKLELAPNVEGWVIASWGTVGELPDSYAYRIDDRAYQPGEVVQSGVRIGYLEPGIHTIRVMAFYTGGNFEIKDSINVK